jgi:hypothetical protein
MSNARGAAPQVHCAKLAGVHERIVLRSHLVMQLRQDGKPVPRLQDARLQKQDINNLQLVNTLRETNMESAQQVACLLQQARQLLDSADG